MIVRHLLCNSHLEWDIEHVNCFLQGFHIIIEIQNPLNIYKILLGEVKNMFLNETWCMNKKFHT